MKQNILIIGTVFPEPNSTAAGSRILQIIEQFQDQNWTVNFATTASKSEFSFDFKTLNINIFEIKLNDSGFDEFIKNLQPSIVIYDRFMTEEQFGWRVSVNCYKCLQILDTIDLHFLRKTRHENLKNKIKTTENELLNSDFAVREIASIYRCDLSLIISNHEMDLLTNYFKIDEKLLFYLPFLVDKMSANDLKILPNYEDRKHFISIGNFKHEPNWDTVLNLKNNIWKRIKKEIPDAELHIYGSYSSEKVLQLNNKQEGFIIKGRAENAHEVIKNARVLLAPIRFGAGLKGKLIDAMQCGTPSVTTKIGAEGMQFENLWNGEIKDNENEFISAAISIYLDKSKWETAQKNGVEIINNCFDKNLFDKSFINQIITIQNDLENHRTQNFIGKMLSHHSNQSTKYMSLWIEEKNK